MTAIYEWGNALRLSGRGVTLSNEIDVQTAGEELEKIRQKQGGAFQNEHVLEAAKKKNNPLHPAFEWNDSAAGEKYRLAQASMLVRAIVIRDESPGRKDPVRAFVKVQPNSRGNGITTIEAAMQDVDSRDYVLQQALNQLRVWRRKWAALNEYADANPIVQNVDKAIRGLQKISAG